MSSTAARHRIAILVLPLVLGCSQLVFPPSALAERAVRPLGDTLSPRLRSTLELAVELARHALETRPGCQAIFAELGSDGLELLARADLRSAEGTRFAPLCERGGASMVTEIHGSTIALCGGSAARLDRFELAARLLHEVLHHAGLSERPHDPDGLHPEQITRMVKRACRL